MASLIDIALRYDLTLDLCPHSVEVTWVDTALSETHSFREHVGPRHERRAALRRCIEKAVAKALTTQQDTTK